MRTIIININQVIYRRLSLVFAVFLLSSCMDDELMRERPLDFLTLTNAYSTPEGVNQGLIGLYSDVRLRWYRNGGDQSFGLFGLGTDIGYDGETPGGQRFLTNYETSVHPEYPVIRNWWLYLYKHIQMANILIEVIENSQEITWNSDQQKNQYLAEAKFFRAWSYRIAVTLWGDIPLNREPIREAKVDFVRTPATEVYQLIEEDLIFAGENLPAPGAEQAPGRLTQGAALHLLTEAYLAQSKFELAVESSSQVIDDYDYALMTERFGAQTDVFGSGDVYYDLFRYGNQNSATNTETIWAIQFEPQMPIGGSNNYWSGIYGPRTFSFGTTPDGLPSFHTGFQDTLGRQVARSRGTDLVFFEVWQGDWENDIRNAEHNIKRNFFFDNPQSSFHNQRIDLSLYPAGSRNLLKDTTNYIYPFFMKTWEPVIQATLDNPAQGGGGAVHTDFYAMRLAETYLLRAEAYLGVGNTPAAAEDINEVRRRANATPVSPGDVDLDYILDERIRELYAEEMRMITLLRTNKLIERTRRYNDNPMLPGANIQEHNRLWPIPQSQIDLNLGADFQQNPGY
ncbi:RagB/SusD family nutrient uptake outer membrane protein [Lunatibacter salilacus]|uniref:RagB/SusD family nutrient uptake outer membrane protein n=1 Tax=Lunatibacter salilacus TaxID=2483804 RepID=UPI00131B2E47|nr:RagB/SusD family nutrient uptake outer membrane protein [Lunatibacter salilacus]